MQENNDQKISEYGSVCRFARDPQEFSEISLRKDFRLEMIENLQILFFEEVTTKSYEI